MTTVWFGSAVYLLSSFISLGCFILFRKQIREGGGPHGLITPSSLERKEIARLCVVLGSLFLLIVAGFSHSGWTEVATEFYVIALCVLQAAIDQRRCNISARERMNIPTIIRWGGVTRDLCECVLWLACMEMIATRGFRHDLLNAYLGLAYLVVVGRWVFWLRSTARGFWAELVNAGNPDPNPEMSGGHFSAQKELCRPAIVFHIGVVVFVLQLISKSEWPQRGPLLVYIFTVGCHYVLTTILGCQFPRRIPLHLNYYHRELYRGIIPTQLLVSQNMYVPS